MDPAIAYLFNDLSDDLRKRAKSELFEDEHTVIHSLQRLRSMLKDEPNLNWQDEDAFLIPFLRARKYDVKRAFDLVKSFYQLILKHPELWANFNYEDVRKTLKENSLGWLTSRDSEGSSVLFFRSEFWDTSFNNADEILRATCCGLLHALLSPATQIAGFKAIFDLSGIGLSKLVYFTPSYIWLVAECMQNSFPARFKGIHIFNEGVVIHYLWTISKRLLSKKLRERFHFHGKNVKKLHKYFPTSILPEDLEGDLPPYDNAEWVERMEESASYFAHVFSHGYTKTNQKSCEKLCTSS